MEQLFYGDELMNEQWNQDSKALATIENKLQTAGFDYEMAVSDAIISCPSNLDVYDYVFSITFGILGALITTNEQLSSFLNLIHECSNSGASSGNPIINFLAKVLRHQGDWMDQVPTDEVNENGVRLKKFVARGAKRVSETEWDYDSAAGGGPHRVFWGHDIFSFQEDNPIFISIKQYGVVKGVLQAVRHLIADTCSKQGIPLPGSSWFDYDRVDEDGNPLSPGNYLLDFCKRYGKELGKTTGKNPNTTFDNEVFDHVFSTHFQDAAASGLASIAITAYCKARKIDNDDRTLQMRIISHGFTFLGAAFIGLVKYDIPYVNWPSLKAMVINTYKLIRANVIDIEKLASETERVIWEGTMLEDREHALRYQVVSGLYSDLLSETPTEGSKRLIELLGKDENACLQKQ